MCFQPWLKECVRMHYIKIHTYCVCTHVSEFSYLFIVYIYTIVWNELSSLATMFNMLRFVCVKIFGLLSRKNSFHLFHFVVLGLKHRSSISRAQPGLTGLDTNHGDLSQKMLGPGNPWKVVKNRWNVIRKAPGSVDDVGGAQILRICPRWLRGLLNTVTGIRKMISDFVLRWNSLPPSFVSNRFIFNFPWVWDQYATRFFPAITIGVFLVPFDISQGMTERTWPIPSWNPTRWLHFRI